MKRLLILGMALAMLLPVSALSAQRRVAFVHPRVFIGGGFGPYWGPYWGDPFWGGPYPYGYYAYPNTGEIKIDTKVKDAQVFVNGGFAGNTHDSKHLHL